MFVSLVWFLLKKSVFGLCACEICTLAFGVLMEDFVFFVQAKGLVSRDFL